ncbi:phage integrase central domain-containing protein [Nonomuraea glycinis]|uniref:phage integrase central domain-containing protein n=1 Tax=Nonomuraea glycinis TaxID=2047744 RepID=UPI002E110E43|nr:N-terminal phage integrase SAM-like domain-containing protein [Nonomuraea glycinis]
MVKDKLIKAVAALESGVTASETYTVRDAVNDWLSKGLRGRSENTVTRLRILAETHVIPKLGNIKLKQLRADHLDEWLDQLADTLATTTLREIHGVLKRAIRQAQARDMVLRNVAELVTTPTGTDGRARAIGRERGSLPAARGRTRRSSR